jgi:phosphate transport system protein
MGDQAVNICQSLQLMKSEPTELASAANVRKMADLACEMVDDALDAFFSRNEEKAIAIRRRDDVVDAMNDQVTKELLTDQALGEVSRDVISIADVVAQILTARSLERIADQAKNICKQVVYLVSAEDVRHVRPQ